MAASPGLAEHEVQQALSGLHVDTLIAFYLYEVERRCLQNCKLCMYVYDKLKWVQYYDVLCAIWQESQRDLDELRLHCRSAFWEDKSSLPARVLQAGEYPAGSDAAMYRVLVPLQLAYQVFRKADVKHFEEYGTALFSMSQYRGREDMPMVRVQVRRLGTWITVHWDRTTVQGGVLEVKAVELGLNYTKADSRFELCQPDSWNVAKDFLAGWAKVLLSTKHAQMQNENTDDWPCEAIRPWPINRVWDMPVVFWLKVQKTAAVPDRGARASSRYQL